jgi:THUMP domain-like
VKLGLPLSGRRLPRAVSYRFNLDDVAFLRSAAGLDALAATEPLQLNEASRLADVKTVRAHTGERFAGAVLETAMLRRRAAAKLDDPGRWLLTAEALQQATPSAVARHRASRLAGRDVHDVTCSIGADLIELARTARRTIGSDLDPIRLAMAAHNLAGVPVQPAQLVRADALCPCTRGAVVFADPSRRDEAGRRRWRANDFAPPLDELATVHTGRDLVVKCAPGLDFDLTPWAAEVELISLDGDVREACLWSPGLATPGVRRRATVLHSTGPAPWTITDADDDTCPVREPGEWIVNPDGAVVRAGLVRQYAARHGLGQLDARIAYLTGDTPPPGTRAFRVIEHGHFTEKALRATLRRLTAGSVEILVRGLDVNPNALRPRLRLRGPASYTVILTRIGHAPTAFICQAKRF